MARFWLLLLAVPAFSQAPIRGYPQEQWRSQHEREEQAVAIPSSERLKIYMERMATAPHHAGSAGAKAVADYALGQFQEWDLDAHIESFDALMPYPTTRVVEMTAPVRYRAQLREPAIGADPDTDPPGRLPPFNAYSASGEVTAPLVYANFGQPEDYQYLKRQGIDLRGKIVIVRYGRGWRGVKAKLAQQAGAVGCLIYSDPHEDGYFQGDVYPRGPMRPEQGVQRGSVLDMQTYPGDPLTPGWASVAGANRLARSDAKTILKIPVMPLSYGDARPLLEQLGGPVAPETWRGALPVTYHLGPGPATVHLKADFDWSSKPLRDVIAVIPGSVYKDQWVIYGNHHDAWVEGANDPVSGAAVVLETARTLAEMRHRGWQPKRTIVLALWDGEEFGLLGSTEWVEKHEAELENKGAVYINSDSNGRGSFAAGGSGTLETFVKEILRDTTDPVAGRSMARSDFRLYPLGAGSDYVPFLDHAGIASLNFGFGSADAGGIYHSSYDTIAWYRRFSDGDAIYERALAQMMARSLIRLADAPVLPYEFHDLARAIRRYLEELPVGIDLHEARAQLARLYAAARLYDDALSTAMRHPVPPEKMIRLNQTLEHAEQTLLLPGGLPDREWYRHQIYAPGRMTGYGAKTLPGVREAVDAQHWDEAVQQGHRLAEALRAMTAQVEESTRLLNESHN